MPAAVGTKALGVSISELVNDLNTNYQANIKWESGQKFNLYPTDASTTPYQGSNFYTYDFLQGQDRYYYPNLVEAYTLYRANGEDTSYLTNALENPTPVEPVLCLASFQERYTSDGMLKSETEGTYAYGVPGTPDYREIHTPVSMDSKESFRFCFGLTPAEAQQGIAGTYSSTNKFCRWAYRIDFGPVNGPALWADNTNNAVGQPIGITFNENAAWRNAITGITIDGNTVNPSHYTKAIGSVTFDSTVFATAGSHIVMVASTGFMNTSVTQNILDVAPTLTADTTNNNMIQPIDITFTDNSAWRSAVTRVNLNGAAVTNYTLASGKLTIPGADFAAAGTYNIVVKATNYGDATVSQPILTVAKGDVNGDNNIDILDVVQVVNFALGKNTPTALQRTTADYNVDGSIDILDVVQIVNKALGR
jgi:hypothetical protein